MTTRRSFVKKAGAGLLAMGASSALFCDKLYAKPETAAKPQEEDLFKVAMAGYSFLRFDIDQTLDMMQRIGVNYLCIKDFHLPLDATQADCDAFHAKLKSKGVTGYGVGPIYMDKSVSQIDEAFEYAKRAGVKLIVGIPKYEDLPYVDKKVKEYGFTYAIHLHGPDNPLYPNATNVWESVKNLDPRIGMCLDIGHDTRDGFNPVEDLEKYYTRVFDIHIKDVTAASRAGTTCEMGRGIIDIPAFVRMLRKVKYAGACSLEYEKDMRDPLAGIAESIGYFKGVMAATK
jgi:sugar phosphate isomerase/epimerase